ncbi:unnamed protein product, partial [Meganyctiphanes norvegica]
IISPSCSFADLQSYSNVTGIKSLLTSYHHPTTNSLEPEMNINVAIVVFAALSALANTQLVSKVDQVADYINHHCKAVTTTIYQVVTTLCWIPDPCQTVATITYQTVGTSSLQTLTTTIYQTSEHGPCQPGYAWNNNENRCVLNFADSKTVTQTMVQVHTIIRVPCQPGFRWDNFDNRCVFDFADQ